MHRKLFFIYKRKSIKLFGAHQIEIYRLIFQCKNRSHKTKWRNIESWRDWGLTIWTANSEVLFFLIQHACMKIENYMFMFFSGRESWDREIKLSRQIEYLLYNLDQAQWLQKDHYQGGICILGDLFDCKGLARRT